MTTNTRPATMHTTVADWLEAKGLVAVDPYRRRFEGAHAITGEPLGKVTIGTWVINYTGWERLRTEHEAADSLTVAASEILRERGKPVPADAYKLAQAVIRELVRERREARMAERGY